MKSYDLAAARRYSAAETAAVAAADASPPVDLAPAAEITALEAQVAALHLQAQELNKQGRTDDATLVYKQMAALDDQALGLQLAIPCRPSAAAAVDHRRAFPDYCCLQQPGATWAQAAEQRGPSGDPLSPAQLRARALGAVLGASLADAAACGVQWVYDTARLAQLAAASPSGHLDFFDPPQCPFFDYPPGSPSPYGQQTRVLLRSLVAEGGLHCGRYAEELFAAFGDGFDGYRDKSTKAFLRRFAAGALPPQTGCEDDQANCFTRLPPLVALFAGAGRPQLLRAVECMIRTTQDDDAAAAFGCAAAVVMESVVLGSSVGAAVADAHDWLLQQAGGGGGHASAVPPARWREVAERLRQAAELAHLPPREAVSIMGRNCHLPGSLQTPLHVLLHLEWRLASGGGSAAAAAAPAAAAGGTVQQQQKQQLDRSGGNSSDGSAAGPDEACLPCSMGRGTACELPGSSLHGAAAVTALRQQQQHRWPATLTAAAYQEAVRLAIREGGCCASRAGLVGAMAGAALDGGPETLPTGWTAQALGWGEEAAAAEALMQLRV